VVVATTVMLSFISFWRAAAIVLSDLASSAYYVGGIAEHAIGKAAPWFILAIMLFSYAVRAIYIESCSMFVRGGVYKVVHEAMGGTLAKFSVSALMFDYVLTGPISSVSAGLYLGGLINEMGERLHLAGMHVYPPYFAAAFAAVVTVYFWRKNIIGIHESSEKALRIMQITTVMVVILIAWCLTTILKNGYQTVPLPVPANLHFDPDAMGWLKGTFLQSITAVAILVGLGHSLLAMSGEESLAQVNREIAHPKLKNLERAGSVIFVYSMLFTSLVSFFAVMIIPDADRQQYLDNLIGGLSMYLVGPVGVRLLFHGFVVLVGTLILAGAVNTAIIGSNGVLNRVAEDGVLPDWFRHPHHKYGTTSRLINLIVGLQILTIIISRGNMEMLGEAYAFGVVWSFAMKALSVLVLRYKQPEGREWKVPLNFHIGKTEIPLGLIMITVALMALAVINVLTKKVATISGVTFTIIFFIVFEFSDIYNRKRKARRAGDGEVPSGRAGRPFRGQRQRAARQCAGGGPQSPPLAAPGAHPPQDRSAKAGHRSAFGAPSHARLVGRAPARSRADLLRRRDRGLLESSHARRKGRQARRVDGGARHGSVRSCGADGRAAAIVAHCHGAFAQAHAFRAGRAGGLLLGTASRAAAIALARDRARKPEGRGLLQPGTAPPAPLARRHRPGPPPVAGVEPPRARRQAASPRHHRRGLAPHER